REKNARYSSHGTSASRSGAMAESLRLMRSSGGRRGSAGGRPGAGGGRGCARAGRLPASLRARGGGGPDPGRGFAGGFERLLGVARARWAAAAVWLGRDAGAVAYAEVGPRVIQAQSRREFCPAHERASARAVHVGGH